MPFPIMGSVLRNALKFKDMLYPPLSEQIQDQAARNDGCDLTGNIDADRRHEQEVLRILRAAQLMHDTRRHRECRDTGSANHGVDLAVFRQEQIQDLRKDDAARRIKNERDKAEPQDEERLGGQKVLRLHLGRNRDSKEQRDEVCEHLLRCFGQRIQQQGLTMQQYMQFTGMDTEKMLEEMRPQAMKRIQTRLVLEAIVAAENMVTSDERLDEEIAKMAEMYSMEADQLKSYMGDTEKEQMKKDLAVQEAVTLLADAAKVTEVVENKEA